MPCARTRLFSRRITRRRAMHIARAPIKRAVGKATSKRGRSIQTAFAVAAHPDDIEFYMAGTLLLLKQAGFEIHYMTLSNGSCGSLVHNAAKMRQIRRLE